MLPVADWVILAALAVVIGLCVRYARRHPRVPPELSGWHVYCGGQTAVVQFYRNAKNGYLTRCNGLGTLTGKPWRKRCPGSVKANLAARRALQAIRKQLPARFRRSPASVPESGGIMFIAVALVAVAVVAVVAFSASYQHQYELDIAYGQAHWVAGMQPLSVEGLITGATLVIWYAARYGYPKRDVWAAYLVLLTAVAQAAIMNLAADHRYHWPWLGPEISVWPAVAFVAGYEMAVWMVRKRAETKKASGAPVPRSSPPGRGTGTSLPALNTSGAPALPSPPAGGSTGTEPPPPVPPRREPRRAVNPREARKGPAAASARVVREQEVLQRLLTSGAPLPSARKLGAEEFGSYQSASAKRVLEQARAAMNGHGASG